MPDRLMQLDAIQGMGEARNKTYYMVRCVSTGAHDDVARQEQQASFWLGQKVGCCGA